MQQHDASQPAFAFRLGTSIASVAAAAERRARYVRVVRATAMLMVVLAAGTYGYWWFTDGEQSPLACLYMTVITVSTVGYTEAIPIQTDGLRGFTIGLILLGGGSLVYFFTAVASSVIEGDLLYGFWRRRQIARLRAMKGHVILAGLGPTGLRAVDELWFARPTLCVIDKDAAAVEGVLSRYGEPLLFINSDAFEEETLGAARIDRAEALVAALPDDRDNLLLCVTARQLNPALRIVVKLTEPANTGMFEDIGVDAMVNPATMGGTRLANELARPELVRFTDAMLAADAHKKELAEVPIVAGSIVTGQTLGEADLDERTGCLVMGLRYSDHGPYRYYPAEDSPLVPGGTVMALGSPAQLRALRGKISRPGRRKHRRKPRRVAS